MGPKDILMIAAIAGVIITKFIIMIVGGAMAMSLTASILHLFF